AARPHSASLLWSTLLGVVRRKSCCGTPSDNCDCALRASRHSAVTCDGAGGDAAALARRSRLDDLLVSSTDCLRAILGCGGNAQPCLVASAIPLARSANARA